MGVSKKYDFSSFENHLNKNVSEQSETEKKQYDFSAFDDLKKKEETPSQDGGQVGTSPAQSPSQLPLTNEEPKQPGNPPGSIDDGFLKISEQWRYREGMPTIDKGEPIDEVSLALNAKKHSQNAQKSMGLEKAFDVYYNKQKQSQYEQKLRESGIDEKGQAQILNELNGIPDELYDRKFTTETGEEIQPYNKEFLGRIRKENYPYYINRVNAIKNDYNLEKEGDKKASNKLANAWNETGMSKLDDFNNQEPEGVVNNLNKLNNYTTQASDIITTASSKNATGFKTTNESLNNLKQGAGTYISSNVTPDIAKNYLSTKIGTDGLELKNQQQALSSAITGQPVPEQDLDSYTLSSIKSKLDPNSVVDQMVFQVYSQKTALEDAFQSATSIEEAAMNYRKSIDPEFNQQITALEGDVNKSTIGETVDSFISDPAVQEYVKKDPALAGKLFETKMKFNKDFPEFAKSKLLQTIGSEYQKEYANWFANNPTTDKLDVIVDKLRNEGKISDEDVKIYKEEIVPKQQWFWKTVRGITTPIGGSEWFKEDVVPTADFMSGLTSGIYGTLKNVAGSIEQAPTIIPSLFGAENPIFSNKFLINKALADKTTAQADPVGFAGTMYGVGNITGFAATLGLLGVPVGAMGIAGEAAHLLPTALAFYEENKKNALLKIPGNTFADNVQRQLLTGSNLAVDLYLTKVLDINKISKGAANLLKNDISEVIGKLRTGSITQAKAGEEVWNKMKDFGVRYLGNSMKTAATINSFTAAHDAVNKLFNAGGKELPEITDDYINNFIPTLKSTVLLSLASSIKPGEKLTVGKTLSDMANNPEYYREMINNKYGDNPKLQGEKEELLNNLDQVTAIHNTYSDPIFKDLTDAQKQKIMLLRMQANLYANKATSTQDPTASKTFLDKSNELSKQIEGITKGKDKALEHETPAISTTSQTTNINTSGKVSTELAPEIKQGESVADVEAVVNNFEKIIKDSEEALKQNPEDTNTINAVADAKIKLEALKKDPVKYFEDEKAKTLEDLNKALESGTPKEELNIEEVTKNYDNLIKQAKAYGEKNAAGVSGVVGKGQTTQQAEPIKGAGTETPGTGGVLQTPGAEGEGKGVGEQVGEVTGVEQEQVVKQMKPFTDKMVDIEREFNNSGYEINTDYDNEIQVLDKNGEMVEPDELPGNLKKLAADYEKATSKLGEFDASAREKALNQSRGIVDTEAEVVETKQAELPKQKEIEQLRAEEQAEYDAMPDPTDEAKRKEIYDKYDKLITPLLRKAPGSVNVLAAPYYDTKIKTIEDAKQLRQSEGYQNHLKTINDVAQKMGLEIDGVDETIGGFVNESGDKITEVSNRIRLKTTDLKKAEEFAAIIGASTHQTQESTIAARYVEHGSPKAVGVEVEMKVDNLAETLNALKEAGIDDFEINENTNSVKIIDFSKGKDKDFSDKMHKFADILDDKNINYATEHHAIESTYIDPAKSSELLREAEIKAEQQQSGSDIHSIIKSAREKREAFIAEKEQKKKIADNNKKLSQSIRALKIDLSKLGGGGLQSNIAGLPISIYNAIVETIAKSVELGSSLSKSIKDAVKQYELNKNKEFDLEEFTDNILNKLSNENVNENPVFFKNAKEFANKSEFDNKIQFKKGLQKLLESHIKELKKIYGKDFDPSIYDEKTRKYLSDVLTQEAYDAISRHPEAIGWYDEKTQAALDVVSAIHPEIATNKESRGAFILPLAIMSNGNKVDYNFDLAEKQYKYYKENGRFNPDGEFGAQQVGIKKSLMMINGLLDNGLTMTDISDFLTSKYKAKDLKVNINGKPKNLATGELANEDVYGATILGAKIGNGFYMNLWGEFDQLTMDRWFMRTWGRMTGTLIKVDPKTISANKERVKKALAEIKKDKEAYTILKDIVGGISDVSLLDLSNKIEKQSADKEIRAKLESNPKTQELKLAANSLAKNVRGEKEAPANGNERKFIRDVFNDVKERLKTEKNIDITMADLQAALWYPEKILYESFKKGESFEEASEGYTEDSAPDYLNAAKKLAKKNNITDEQINQALSAGRERAGESGGKSDITGSEVAIGSNKEILGKVKTAISETPSAKPKKLSQQKNVSVGEEGKKVASALRKAKIKLGDGGLQSNIAGLPIAIYNAAIETIATSIEKGATLAEAISNAIKELKLNENKDFNESEFSDKIKDIQSTQKEEKEVAAEEDPEMTKMANAVNDAFIEGKFGTDVLDKIIAKLQDTDTAKIYNTVREKIKSGVLTAKEVRDRILTTKQGSEADQAVLMYDLAELKGKESGLMNEMINESDPGKQADTARKLLDVQNEMQENALANRYLGRTASSIFRLRQLFVNREMDLATMEKQYISSKGIESLTPEQSAEVKEAYNKIKGTKTKLEKTKGELDKLIQEDEVRKAEENKLNELKQQAKIKEKEDRNKKAQEKISASIERMKRIKANLRSLRGNMSSGVDPKIAIEIGKLAAEKFYQKAVKLDVLVKDILAEVKDIYPNWTENDVRNHLFPDLKDANKYFTENKDYKSSKKELRDKIDEYKRLQSEYAKSLFEWQKERRTDLMDKRPWSEKLADKVYQWQRFAVLTYPTTFVKLAAVVGHNLLLKPFRFGYQKVIANAAKVMSKDFAGKMGVYGDPSLKAMAKYYSEFIRNFSLANLKEQFSGIDTKEVLYGDKFMYDEWSAGKGLLEMPGRSHGYIKSFVKNPEFQFAHEMLVGQAMTKMAEIGKKMEDPKLSKKEKNELKKEYDNNDITNEDVLMRINKLSLEHGKDAILMGDNKTVDKFRELTKGSGAASTFLKTEAPIVKIPLNYISRALLTKYGLMQAITGKSFGAESSQHPSVAKLIFKGTKGLTEAQGQALSKAIMYGSMGATMFALGYFNKDKVKLNEDGSIEFNGMNISKNLIHVPEFESFFSGVETAHKFKDEGSKTNWIESFLLSDLDVIKKNPFLNMLEYGLVGGIIKASTDKNMKDESKVKMLEDAATNKVINIAIPGFSKQLAQWMDTEEGKGIHPMGTPIKRKPQGNWGERFVQSLEMAIPGLRQLVPTGEGKKTFDEKQITESGILKRYQKLGVEFKEIPSPDKLGLSEPLTPEQYDEFVKAYQKEIKLELVALADKEFQQKTETETEGETEKEPVEGTENTNIGMLSKKFSESEIEKEKKGGKKESALQNKVDEILSTAKSKVLVRLKYKKPTKSWEEY